MKLYYSPDACSLADHITAREAGLTPDLVKVDLKAHVTETGQDFYKVNPKGYVPALGLDDGTVLTENAAILSYLGDKGGLMPDGMGRYRVLEWMAFINSEIHKSFSPLFRGVEGEAAAKTRSAIDRRLAYTAQTMAGDYLMGAHFTPPDAYLYVMLRWCEKFGVTPPPRLADFKARMEVRPGVQAALKAEGL